MASKILLKKSTTASQVPTTSDVDVGEVAVNTEDKRLFTQDNGGSVVELGTTPSSVAVTNNATVGGTLGVTGNTTLSGTLGVTGTTTASTVNATDITVSGTLTVPTPTSATDAASKGYVDTEVSDAVAALVDSAPTQLDTLNELAAAINDQGDFATQITTTIGTKLPKDGSEAMSGELDLGTNKIVNVVDPTSAQDVSTKNYVDTQDALKLSLTGGTMSGAIAMGTSKITGMGDPTLAQDAATKAYVDSFVSGITDLDQAVTDAEAAQTAAELAQGLAEDAQEAAETAQGLAETAQTAAETAYDNFDDRYLGAKATAPALDNDGDALITGALYFDTSSELMYVYTGTSWVAAGSAVNGTSERQTYTATASQTTFAITYDIGFVDVYLNGVKLLAGTDFTATNGTSVVLSTGATAGDIVDIVAYGSFELANTYTQAAADAKFTQVANNLSDLASASTARTNLGLGTMAVETATDYVATADIGSTVQAYDADTAKLDVAQTFTAQQTFGELKETVFTLGTSGTVALDPANGSIQTCASSGPTFTDSLEAGQTLVLHITGGDSSPVTFPTVTWVTSGGNVAPTATASDVFVFWKVSTTLYGAYVGNFV